MGRRRPPRKTTKSGKAESRTIAPPPPPKRARLAAGDVADAVSTSVRPQQPVHDQHERDDGGATSQLSFGQPANENAEDEPEAEADSGSKRPRLDEVSV